MMRRISIRGLRFSFGRKSREKKPERSVSSEINRESFHVSASEAGDAENDPEHEEERSDSPTAPSSELKARNTKTDLTAKANQRSSSAEIQVPRRKERGGLLGTIGRKIRASFRRKRDSSSEENYVMASKSKKKQKMKPATQRAVVCPVERTVPSSTTSEEPSDSAIGVSVHPQPKSRQYISVPSGPEKRETHSSCSSDSCEHDNNVLRCSKISVNIHSCDTSDSSDRNGHVVNLEKVSIEVNSLNIAEKPVNSDSAAAASSSPQKTQPKTPLRTPCVSLSRTNPKKLNNGQPQPSSSGAKARPLSDVVGLYASTSGNNSRRASSNLEDTSNKAPTVPPRPDLLSVTSSAGATNSSVHQRNLNHAIFSHPSLGFGFGFTLTGDCFEPYEASPTSPLYDEVKDAPKIWSLTKELLKLSKFGWYWGPLTRVEAEEKLSNQANGAFLVRDSSDDRYLLSLSFRSNERTLHTRIEHCNGMFSFYAQPESEGYSSIVDLIEHSMTDSLTGVFCYSRARTPGSPSFPVRLTKPVSRFTQVRSLQYLCRFVIRQYTRLDHIQKLPLPNRIKGWLEENQY
ncbi:suppressor of cytokine signaling 6-like [Lineus longissimus]|uniref:suppressor of cytokine signaling 6-like n=1 Tax=Lineus longissimus TaxID=88925 RepID=UPI00315DAB68